MTTQIQRRRGTTVQHSSFTGAEAEITIDTDKETVVVHDGSTAGGIPLLRAEGGAQNISTSGDITVNTDAFFVDASAKEVGIGTASPSSALDISGAISLGSVAIPSAGTARIFSRNTDDVLYLQPTSGGKISFLDGSQNTMGIFEPTAIKFAISNSEAMRIDSSGRVGIGTASPAANLQITPGTGAGTLLIDNASGSTTDGALNIEVGSSGAIYETRKTGGLDHIWYATGAERMRIDSSGKIILPTGSPGIQFGSPDDPSASGGIDISSQTLDDYEEGTWTPAIAGGSLTNGGAYYTKIGNFVNFYCYMTSLNIPDNSNDFQITGLPFTCTTGYGGPCQISYSHTADDTGVQVLRPNIQNAQSYMYMHFVGTGSATPPLMSWMRTHFQGKALNIQGCYFA